MWPTTPSLDWTASVQTPFPVVASTKRRGAVSINIIVSCAGAAGGAIGPSSNVEGAQQLQLRRARRTSGNGSRRWPRRSDGRGESALETHRALPMPTQDAAVENQLPDRVQHVVPVHAERGRRAELTGRTVRNGAEERQQIGGALGQHGHDESRADEP